MDRRLPERVHFSYLRDVQQAIRKPAMMVPLASSVSRVIVLTRPVPRAQILVA